MHKKQCKETFKPVQKINFEYRTIHYKLMNPLPIYERGEKIQILGANSLFPQCYLVLFFCKKNVKISQNLNLSKVYVNFNLQC